MGPPIELAAALSANWLCLGLLTENARSPRRPVLAVSPERKLWEERLFRAATYASVAAGALVIGFVAVRVSLSAVLGLALTMFLFMFAVYAPIAFLFFGMPASRNSRSMGPLIPCSTRTQGYVALVMLPVVTLWMYWALARRYGGFSAA